MKKFLIFLLIALLLSATLSADIDNTFGFNFDKNFLIADSVFTDYTAMNLDEISSFLKNQGSILAKYKENGVSAAQIIFDASRKYRINPKVILTTLQKEEGLITLSYYNSYAINFAMGFHRPSDFKNQVYGGTKLLRDGYDFLAEKYGWKVGIPRKTEDDPSYVKNIVIPKNKATASLYLYTPYIGGYFKANGTYIGGNYNFVKIFNRWFGDPTKYTSIALTPEKSTFYVPSGANCTVPVKIKNNGNTVLKKGEYYISLTNSETIRSLEPIPINRDIKPGEEKTFFITVNKIVKSIKAYFAVKKKGGKIIGNKIAVIIIPVNLSVTYKKSGEKLLIKIKSDKNVPYAYMKVRLTDTNSGECVYEKDILIGTLLGDKVSDTITIPAGYENLALEISFIGRDSACNTCVPIVFFREMVAQNKNIYMLQVDTTPSNAYVFVDEKLIGKSPVHISLKQGVYVITVKDSEKTVKKELNLFCNTEMKFVSIRNNSAVPPSIDMLELPRITNQKNISIEGKIKYNSKIARVSVNGNAVSITPSYEFSIPLTLSEGNNKITINVIDVYGNSETIYPEITLDTIPPKIIVGDVPEITPNMFFKLSAKVIGGTALFIDGKQCKFTECSVFLRLKKGENIITITALDGAGNKSEEEKKIMYLPPNPTILKLFIGKKFLYVNGAEKKIDTAPIIKENRTMLPVRHIIEALNGQIYYYAESRTVEIKINGGDIVLAIGKNRAIVNGEEKQIDVRNKSIKPFIENGRTYLPLRFVMESIGSAVEWLPDERSVVIIYPEIT